MTQAPGQQDLPILGSRDLFDEAQRILERRLLQLSSEELLKKLRILHRRYGHLSRTVIDRTEGMPKAHVYDSRFSSLREAYALIGYTPETNCDYLEARAARTSLIKGLADQIAANVPKIKPNLIAERSGGCLAVKDDFFVSLRVARCWQHPQRRCSTWTLRRGAKARPGLVVIARMNEKNERPVDYVLAPMISLPERPLIVTEEALARRYRCRSESIGGLIRALKRRL